MEPMDLFSALTDVDDQDVLEALDVYTRKPKQKRVRRIITVAATLIVAALVGIATHRYLQGKGKMDEKSPKGVENSMEYITITPSIIEKKPTVPEEETPICTIYQFMLFRETEYVASIENCDRIGDEIGTARVRNEENEDHNGGDELHLLVRHSYHSVRVLGADRLSLRPFGRELRSGG